MRSRTFVLAAVAVCALLAGVVSAWASGHPDGLEFVAHETGFAHVAAPSLTAGSPWADYPNGASGIAGCVVVFALVTVVTSVTRRFTRG